MNSQTGTVLLKGSFANTERHLWPGQFVTVVPDTDHAQRASSFRPWPSRSGQEGKFVYVVKSDMTVEIRPVAPGMSVGETRW